MPPSPVPSMISCAYQLTEGDLLKIWVRAKQMLLCACWCENVVRVLNSRLVMLETLFHFNLSVNMSLCVCVCVQDMVLVVSQSAD